MGGVTITETLEIPLSPQYCRNWGPVEALREIIANSLDSQDPTIKVSWDLGVATIYNSKSQLEKRNLVMGETTKADDNTVIGTFGEGLKVGALALCRLGNSVIVESGKMKILFHIGYSETFETEILLAELSEKRQKQGTTVEVHIDEDIFKEAKNLFMRFQDRKPRLIYNDEQFGSLYHNPKDSNGSIYSHGVKIYDGTGYKGEMLFTWDLNNLEINRDRTIIDAYAAGTEMENIFDGMVNESEKATKSFLKKWLAINKDEGETIFESRLYLSEESDHIKTYLKDRYGPIENLAIETGEITGNMAKEKGYRVLKLHEKARELLTYNRVKLDSQTITEDDNYIKSENLTSEEENLLHKAKTLSNLIIEKTFKKELDYEISVFDMTMKESTMPKERLEEAFSQNETTITLGGYNKVTNNIMIRRILLNKKEFMTLMEVYLHELTHKVTGAYDGSRVFDDALGKTSVYLIKFIMKNMSFANFKELV